jgi:uncharacterized membrane protein
MSAFRTVVVMAIVCGISLVLAACSHKEPAPAQRPALSEGPPVSELSSGPVEESPTDSSLSIKRGIVTSADDHALFQACDDKTQLWLIDEADGTVTQMLTEGDQSAFYIEAYGERGAVPDTPPAAKAQAGAFVIEQLLYAGVVGEGRGCDQPAPDFLVLARGNEPFWSVKVTDNNMIWRQPDAPQESVFDELQSEDAEGSVTYRASAAGRTLELAVDAQSCRDSMSGEYFAFTARALLDEKEFTGCARVGKQDAH